MSSFLLCSFCLDFFVRPQESFHDGVSSQYDLEAIPRSAQEGCPICFWFQDDLLKPYRDAGNVNDAVITTTLRIGEFEEDEEVFDMSTLEYTNILRVVAKLSRVDGKKTVRSFEYPLRSTVEVGGGIEAMLKPSNDHQGRYSVPACTAPVPKNTRDPLCSETIRKWLNTCTTEHKLCQTPLSKKVGNKSPTRLIDSADLNNPRLVELDQTSGICVQYVTVSHRWNATIMPKLTTSNIAEYTQRIDFKGLPPAFRDSISVTAWLGIRYIWIDALCIIQDSKFDAQKEIALMGHIYLNAFCNIGAHAAACAASDQPVGLFVDRNPLRVSMALITVERKEFRVTYCGYPQVNWCPLPCSTLMHRGWVFQERLLSPRSIYFGEKLHWECSELQACETFPRSAPAVSSVAPWGNGFPLRAGNLLHDDHKYIISVRKTAANSAVSRTREMYRKWLHVVEAFSPCQLTYESDCFPAISGLARYFQDILEDEYVAGVWRRDLLSGLVWYPDGDGKNIWPSKYLAPSWSWASVRHGVIFPLAHDIIFSRTGYVWTAKVHDMAVTLDSADPFGSIVHGYLEISAPLRTAQTAPIESISKKSRENFKNWFDKEECESLPGVCYYLLLGYRTKRHNDNTIEICNLQGLLLDLVKPEAKVYRRIGMFHHEWVSQGHAIEPESVFIDFKPGNYETESITIT